MDELIRELSRKIVEEFTKQYGDPIGEGRNRITFRMGMYVLKVPLNGFGLLDNEFEASHPSDIHARCSLFFCYDLPIVKMEYVRPVTGEESLDLPDWTEYVDCFQVGYTYDGRLVAYDYGPY